MEYIFAQAALPDAGPVVYVNFCSERHPTPETLSPWFHVCYTFCMAKTTTTTKKSTDKTKKSNLSKSATSTITTKRVGGKLTLKNFNLLAALVLLAEAVAILVMGKSITIPVVSTYLTTDSLASNNGAYILAPAIRHLFDVNIRYLVGAFMVLPALMYALQATAYKAKYQADLDTRSNRFRWTEFTLSAGLLLITVATLSGIRELSSLLMIFAFSVVVHLACLIAELIAGRDAPILKISYLLAVVAGVLPWVAVALTVWGANMYGEAALPRYLYGSYAAVVVTCSAMALVTHATLAKRGRFANYEYAERAYIVLNVLAKSAVAWLIFAGALR
jgi:hypothetical protein